MVAMDTEISAVLAQRLIEHHGGEFVERIGAETRIVCGCQRTLRITKIRKGRQQRSGSENQQRNILGKRLGGADEVLEGSQIHSVGLRQGKPANGGHDLIRSLS